MSRYFASATSLEAPLIVEVVDQRRNRCSTVGPTAQAPFVLGGHQHRIGDSAAALAGAPHRLQGTLHIGGQEHFYLETQISSVMPSEDGGMIVYCSTQNPTEVQKLVAEVLGVSFNRIVAPHATRLRPSRPGAAGLRRGGRLPPGVGEMPAAPGADMITASVTRSTSNKTSAPAACLCDVRSTWPAVAAFAGPPVGSCVATAVPGARLRLPRLSAAIVAAHTLNTAYRGFGEIQNSCHRGDMDAAGPASAVTRVHG